MKQLYYVFILSLLLSSCYSAQVHYMGSSYQPTKKIDVYVDASAIKKPYTVIGKGYTNTIYERALERVQDNAIAKAREKGADAVLFNEVYIVGDGSTISGTSRSDSIGKSMVTVSSAHVRPVVSSRREILFLKYN